MSSWRRPAGLGGILLAIMALAAACGGTVRTADAPAIRTDGRRAASAIESTDRVPSQAAPREGCRGGRLHAVGSETTSYAAVARRPALVRRAPSGVVRARFGRLNENGHVTVFGIREVVRDSCGRLWYRVALPLRPNGATGFVMARDVRVLRVDARILVDLSDRRVTLYRNDTAVIRSPVAVGAPATPTPTGHYYVNQRLLAADPTGPWGPGAIGISAFSPVLRNWPQGGPIAIHGTNDPGSIGRAASHGCVRVPNATLRRLLAATPAGTPVEIRE